MLRKKDFQVLDTNYRDAPQNQNVSQKVFYERSMPDENYKFHKKRAPNFEVECKSELDYLFAFWETLKPGDYLLKCDFYKTGVKINKDRMVPVEIVVSAIQNQKDIREIYRLDKSKAADGRLKEMRTVNPNFMTFHEFVKFLYWDQNVRKTAPEDFEKLREKLVEDAHVIDQLLKSYSRRGEGEEELSQS